MSTSPVRQVLAARRGLTPSLLLAMASVSAMFAATPLVLPELTASFGIGTETVGWVSAMQVGAFAVASFLGGRLLSGSNTLLRISIVVLAVFNLVSAFAPTFLVLVLARVATGLSGGVINWLAWRQASRHPESMGTVASVGPAVAAVASVVFGVALSLWSYPGAYVLLSLLAAAALAIPPRIDPVDPIGRELSPSKSNRVILVALTILTLSGSALFIYVGFYLGPAQGAPEWLLSWGLAANALAGWFGAQRTTHNGALWVAATSLCALVMGVANNVWVATAAMILWGLFFWFGLPATLRLLDDYSLRAGERSGDAQALMAAGRVAGPLVGGTLLAAGSPKLLGVVAASGMGISSLLLLFVQRYRAANPQPPARPS